MKKMHITASVAALSLVLAGPGLLCAEEMDYADDDEMSERSGELRNAKETLKEAADVVEQMNDDADARKVLDRAQAVFVVPDYARASFIAGAAGGQGVLMSRTDDGWSGPAFYNIGAVNLGATAGIEGGSIAFMILSEDALRGFRDEHNFSLNADAGLTILNWSERAQATAGKGADVVIWSDTEGLYGDLSISVTDIFADDEANAAYYGSVVEPVAIIDGEVSDPMQDSDMRSEFSALEEANSDTKKQDEMDESAQKASETTGSKAGETQ